MGRLRGPFVARRDIDCTTPMERRRAEKGVSLSRGIVVFSLPKRCVWALFKIAFGEFFLVIQERAVDGTPHLC